MGLSMTMLLYAGELSSFKRRMLNSLPLFQYENSCCYALGRVPPSTTQSRHVRLSKRKKEKKKKSSWTELKTSPAGLLLYTVVVHQKLSNAGKGFQVSKILSIYHFWKILFLKLWFTQKWKLSLSPFTHFFLSLKTCLTSAEHTKNHISKDIPQKK